MKLRGFRIELGEIEAQLCQQEVVSEAVVVLRERSAGAWLVGYVVPVPGAAIDPVALRAALSRQLPDYNVPSRIVVLDRLPLTPNGKLDRDALPAPSFEAHDLVPPQTELEAKLAEIWQDVLQLPAVGINQNFFDLGGDSLSALRVLTRLRRLFPDKRITIVDLFNNQDIEQLAAALTEEEVGTHQVIHMRWTGNRPMLYCIPGLLVSTREYVKLVNYLGGDQPATGFICYSLTDSIEKTVSVQELAARYADYIRDHSKGDACFLLGWSWGGILAYEAARMLAGDVDLKFVGMLDVCALDTEFAIGAEAPPAEADRAQLQRRIDTWLDRTAMRRDWENLFERMDTEAYTQFLAYVHRSKDNLPTDGPDIGSREHIFWTLIENALIFRNYIMKPFDCPIHAWLAEESLNRGLNVIDWRQYSRRVERVVIIPGTTHLQIVNSEAFHRSFAESVEQIRDAG